MKLLLMILSFAHFIEPEATIELSVGGIIKHFMGIKISFWFNHDQGNLFIKSNFLTNWILQKVKSQFK